MLHSDVCAQSIAKDSKLDSGEYRPINYVESATLLDALNDDAVSLAQASLASFFEGLDGVHRQRFTWAVVKFYYSMFYSIRAIMMLRKCSVFYMGRTPHVLYARPGSVVSKKGGNSHSVIFKEFKSKFSSDELLSQGIDQDDPLEWLEKRRNNASYKSAPFDDPIVPPEFVRPVANLRNHVEAYCNDQDGLLASDPQHAVIAFPLKVLLRVNREIDYLGLTPDPLDAHYPGLLISSGCLTRNLRESLSHLGLPQAT